MSLTPKFTDRPELAPLIRFCKADILVEWDHRARQRVAAAQAQSRLALRDSLPQFIDRLIATLGGADPQEEAMKNAAVAREHGEDRARQHEYTLAEVVIEYHILRTVIIEKIAASGGADAGSVGIVHEFIDRGMAKAAARYHEIELGRESLRAAELDATRIEAQRANLAKTAFLGYFSFEQSGGAGVALLRLRTPGELGASRPWPNAGRVH